MKRILLIVLVLWSAQVSAQPWFWGDLVRYHKVSGKKMYDVNSSGDTVRVFDPASGTLTLQNGNSSASLSTIKEGVNNNISIISRGINASTSASLTLTSSRGTNKNRSPLLINDIPGQIIVKGFDGTSDATLMLMYAIANQNLSDTCTLCHSISFNWRLAGYESLTAINRMSFDGRNDNWTFNTSGTGDVGVGVGSSNVTGRLHVISRATNNITGIFQRYAGQTVDLTQWQDNGGVVLAKVDKDGNIDAPNLIDSVTVRGDSLLEWKNGTPKFRYLHTAGAVGGYDSTVMASKYSVDTMRTRINANIAALSGGGGYDSTVMASKYYVDTAKARIETEITAKANTSALGAAAFSNSYNDLSDLPTLFDGDYNSLTNKPTKIDSAGYSDTAKYAPNAGQLSGHLASYYLDRANQTGTQAWGTITGTPTTISGYGITDFNSLWDTRLATKSTTNLTEGSNLYYTDARARAALSSVYPISYNSTTGIFTFDTSVFHGNGYYNTLFPQFTGSYANPSWITSLAGSKLTGAFTSSGMTMNTARLLGRSTASSGAVEEISIGTGLSLAGNVLSATGGGGGGTNPVIYVQTADASVTASATETNMLGTGNGSATLSAGLTNHVGDMIEVYASGQFIIPSSASGNSVWKLYYGSTALATSPTMDISSATGAFIAATGNWEFKGTIVTRTTGASGTVMVTGQLTFTAVTSGSPSFPYAYTVKMDNVTATTADLTATQAITFTQKFSTGQSGKTANGKNSWIKYYGTP